MNNKHMQAVTQQIRNLRNSKNLAAAVVQEGAQLAKNIGSLKGETDETMSRA